MAAAALLVVACTGLDGLSGGSDPAADAAAPAGPDGGGNDAESSVAATPTLVVTKSGTGKGVVVSQDLGVDCGNTCSHSYALGAVVALTATPLAGSAFTGWQTPCSGTGVCSVTLTGDVNVAATFGLKVLEIDDNRAYESSKDGTPWPVSGAPH